MTNFDLLSATVGADIAILFWTVVISKLISLVSGGGVSLVVKKLSINAGDGGTTLSRVEIAGRREGLMAFLLTLIGLSPTTNLVVDHREAVCKTSGLLGIAHQSVPLDRVAQVTTGSKVAFEYILSALIMGLVGLSLTIASLLNVQMLAVIGVPVLTAVFAGIAILLYYLNKRFYVGVFPQGGWPMLMVFKPNVIEGVELNLERALEIGEIIRKLTVNSRPTPSEGAQHAHADVASLPPEPMETTEYSAFPAYADEFADETATAASLLRDAQDQIRSGQQREAVATLRNLVRDFPDTPEAAQAARALERASTKNQQ